MPGVYRHGRGQYSDNASGMGLTSVPGSGGQGSPVGKTVEQAQREGLVGERVGYNPAYDQRLNGATGISAQNMAAADALVARNTPAGFQPAGSPQASVQAPIVRNSTNDWAARNALRNAEVSASSITNRPEWQSGSTTQAWSTRSNGVADPQGKVAAYRAAVANDQALQQAQPGMDKAAMDGNTALQREGIQQAGATGRTAMQEQGATAREAGRTALAGEEMGLKRTAAGFQTRALQRVENLQTRYEAEKDPAKRSELARQLREIQGKEQPSEWGIQVTPATKNADGSTTEGSVIRYNKATGQAERVDTGASVNAAPLVRTPADLAKLPKGAQFMDEKGQLRVKN